MDFATELCQDPAPLKRRDHFSMSQIYSLIAKTMVITIHLGFEEADSASSSQKCLLYKLHSVIIVATYHSEMFAKFLTA